MHVSCVYFAYDKMQLVYFQNVNIFWQLWQDGPAVNLGRPVTAWPLQERHMNIFMEHNSQKLK